MDEVGGAAARCVPCPVPGGEAQAVAAGSEAARERTVAEERLPALPDDGPKRPGGAGHLAPASQEGGSQTRDPSVVADPGGEERGLAPLRDAARGPARAASRGRWLGPAAPDRDERPRLRSSPERRPHADAPVVAARVQAVRPEAALAAGAPDLAVNVFSEAFCVSPGSVATRTVSRTVPREGASPQSVLQPKATPAPRHPSRPRLPRRPG